MQITGALTDWPMQTPAVKVAERLTEAGHTLPAEVLRLDDQTAAIVVEVDGVDYVLTMTRVPKQRERPAIQ